MNAVGIDVSKGKSMVCVMRPFEQSWTNPNYFPLLQQQSRHPQSGWFENHPCS